jgi:hypothetical protein
MQPVLGREIVEGEQALAVLRQTLGGLGVFRRVGGEETLEGALGIGPFLRSHLNHWGCRRHQPLRYSPQVLSGRCQDEFVLRSAAASQP